MRYQKCIFFYNVRFITYKQLYLIYMVPKGGAEMTGSGNMRDFIDFMGFRNMVLEDRIQECVDAMESGRTDIQIDCTDMTSDEQEFFREELERRLNR